MTASAASSGGQKRSRGFAQRIIAWQRRYGRHDLPWQNTRDPYRIWLAEIMLQQTQVSTVIGYYQRFLAALPDVASLASAPIERVLQLWSGLGYYRRAHYLHATANVVIARHEGMFPCDVDAIAALPGIGRSTAAAIAAFAYDTHVPILDGNVKRVLARHRGIAGFPGVPKVAAALWREAQALLPDDGIVPYTQGLMDLGTSVCTRSAPHCGECPVRVDCVARNTLRIDTLPSPRPAKLLPQRAVQVLLLERAGEILLQKRAPTGIWPGLWCLPEIACDEDAIRYCGTHFGASVVADRALPLLQHGFTHFHLTLHPRHLQVKLAPALAERPGFVWLTRDDAIKAAVPAPIRKLLKSL